MNIFFTNSDPIIAANEHNNTHQVKMILEHCQMLSTAHHVLDGAAPDGAYKKTHTNHPSAVWVRESVQHYEWLWLCTKRLCELYTARTGKIHATERVLDILIDPPSQIQDDGFTKPPVAAPDDFKLMVVLGGVEVAYQQYLNHKYAEWLGRDRPMKVEWTLDTPSWVTI